MLRVKTTCQEKSRDPFFKAFLETQMVGVHLLQYWLKSLLNTNFHHFISKLSNLSIFFLVFAIFLWKQIAKLYSLCLNIIVISLDGEVIMALAEHSFQARDQLNSFQSWPVTAFLLSKYVVSSGSQNYVNLWNISNPKRHLTLDGHTKKVTNLAFSPN